MKPIRNIINVLALFTLSVFLFAALPTKADDLSAQIEAALQTDPLPADEVPPVGAFYSASNPGLPPVPGNMKSLPAWNLGNNNWLLDDVDADTGFSMMGRSMADDVPSPGDGGGDDGGGGDYTNYPSGGTPIDTNGLYLEITNVANGWSYLNLHNATNQVYSIWSTTNLATSFSGWNVEAELFPTLAQTNVMPFTVQNLERNPLFIPAEDWTGVDSDGDGIPDWWIWKYFGDLSETSTNLDSQGNTLGNDYTNSLDPDVISFSIESTNDYVNTTSANVQLDITAGNPSYYAVLVNADTTTNWQTFSATNIATYLGSTDGVYTVNIGLRGLPADATQTWESYSFTLDRVAPLVTITNPAGSTVTKPYLQLQGFANEQLSSLSYDISNAFGLATHLDAFVTDQYFDTNKFDFTTNYFQAYDVPLATNVNYITLRVTDRAGNTTTTNFNVTLDYTAATNPPMVSLIWPQDGMAVSGSNCTIRGTMSDETGTIQATVVNGDGTTKVIAGIVERNRNFWIENVPLNGTNLLSIQATDAAGNVTTTNITIMPSTITLTIDTTPTGDDLYQPSGSVSGTVSDPTATVTVNGVLATISGTNWSADSVPILGAGTATFNAAATPSGGAPPVSHSTDLEYPAKLVVSNYHFHTYWNVDDGSLWPYGGEYQKDFTQTWVPGSNGWQCVLQGTADDRSWDDDDTLHGPGGGDTTWQTVSTSHYEWSATNENTTTHSYYNGTLTGSSTTNHVDAVLKTSLESSEWGTEYYADANDCDWFYGSSVESEVDAKAELKLYTGGKAKVNRQNLFCIQASGTEYKGNPWTEYGKDIPADQLTTTWGKVGADGKQWKVLPDNAALSINLTAPGKKHYYAEVTQQKYPSRFEVFVRQPYPLYPKDEQQGLYGPYGPPLGYPWYDSTGSGIEAGHAWWELTIDAPNDAISQFTSTNCSRWISQAVGYGYDTSSLDCWRFLIDSSIAKNGAGKVYSGSGSYSVYKTYAIGFQGAGLIDGLNHTEYLFNNPGTWDSQFHNCVHETVVTGSHSGKKLPLADATPEMFGFALPASDP